MSNILGINSMSAMSLLRNFYLIQKSSGFNCLKPTVSPKICRFCSEDHPRLVKIENSLKEKEINLINELTASLGCTRSKAKIILWHHPEIKEAEERLRQNIFILKGVFRKNLIIKFPKVLCLSPSVVRNRIQIMDESTIKKTPLRLCNLNYLVKFPVSKLKAYNVIEENTDVLKILVSKFDDIVLPSSLSSRLSSSLSEKQRLNDLRTAIIKCFLKSKFNLNKREMNALKLTGKTFVDLSFHQLTTNVDFLLNVADFSERMILDNFELLKHMNTPNLFALFNAFKARDCDIRTKWKEKPSLLKKDYQQIQEKLRLLEDYRVSFVAVDKTPEALSLPLEILRNRLEVICGEKELGIFRFHSRFLQCVLNPSVTLRQVDRYKKLGYDKLSMTLILDEKEDYQVSLEKHSCKRGQFDVADFIATELKLPKEECISQLKRHPFWSTVPLIQIQETLDFLRSKDFSKEDIRNSLQIILYPRVRVEMELLLLRKRPFIECCHDTSAGMARNSVKRELVLPLLLYFLEKQTKFSGSGVWLDNNVVDSELDERIVEDDRHFLKSEGDEISSVKMNEPRVCSKLS